MPEIHELIQKRQSAVAFTTQEVTQATLLQLFEAARWAASCFNEQPWHFIFGSKGNQKGNQKEDFERLFSCLLPANQAWAKSASVLLLAIARHNFVYKERHNPHALYDLGQAVTQLSLQATHLSVNVHQMAGFDKTKARSELNIPDGYEPVAMIALGYPAKIDDIDPELRDRATTPRTRKKLSDFLFQGRWGEAVTNH